jgi:RNA polymerase sigma-70 factor, ECF subfamily
VPDQQQGQITTFLESRRQNDEEPFSALVPLIYKELRHLSHDHLRSERPNHTLQSAAFARRSIASTGGFGGCIADPVPFHCGRFGLMRQILVDYARNRGGSKRDGGCRVELDSAQARRLRGCRSPCPRPCS